MNEKFEIYQKKEIIEDLPGKKKKGKLQKTEANNMIQDTHEYGSHELELIEMFEFIDISTVKKCYKENRYNLY